MAPRRHRNLENRDLNGTNIKVVNRRTVTTYYYRMPDGKLENLGHDRREAIEAAVILNEHLRPVGDRAKDIINNQGKRKTPDTLDSVNILIDKFDEYYLSKKNYTERTLGEKYYKLRQYRKMWGERSASEITTQDIAGFLNQCTDNAYIKHRNDLKTLFAFAIHQGYRDDNPVTATMKRVHPKRKRERHTLEGYKKIHTIAPEWLKRAMDIALMTLQRRGDLTRIHRDQVDMEKGTIKILQGKTRNYKNPVFIEIQMGKELEKSIKACLTSGVLCPYLLHHQGRTSAALRKRKLHPFALTDEFLSKQFTKYRDQSEAYHHLTKEQRPTFHDIRALGIYLYESSGFPDSYIQALSGHATKTMLEHYKDGHEAPKPVHVKADLDLTTAEHEERIRNE